MNPKIKISQLPAKGANLAAADLLEIAEFTGTGYISKSITGQEIIDAAAGSGVTSVTGTAPIASSGGTTPAISIATANTSTAGALSSTDWNTFNGKQAALVSGTNIKTVNSTSLLGSGNVAVQDPITLTTTGTSGAATLVGATLNIPQYSGGGSANPSVIALSATDGTAITGTTTETISRSLLIPANTFTTDGMLEVLARMTKTGALGTSNMRIYKNTSNTLTGATLIASTGSNTAAIVFNQAIRNFRINSNTLSGFSANSSQTFDYASSSSALSSTTFTTNVDNYILFSIQLANTADSANVSMARVTKSI